MSDPACALASLEANEPLAGTAVESIDRWVLLEVTDVWAPKVLDTEALPELARLLVGERGVIAVLGPVGALTTEGADHFLGNLICRLERDAPPQEDALQMALIATTNFLNSFLKEDPKSRAFIDGDQLQQLTEGFSRLGRR